MTKVFEPTQRGFVRHAKAVRWTAGAMVLGAWVGIYFAARGTYYGFVNRPPPDDFEDMGDAPSTQGDVRQGR
ncbi:hypothetical protein HYH03_005249 [Edaphochlamys debaryana]|uniref:Uncharacterized protein n=1 Tax=Edaphochlamys debaryana TaxID=47281 RepID=A0A835Y631_9CHLO|nr:hypothetical protein HYH03_005249 [Edaphochlamys debaryana]|eukprot:KAG2496845.1 hypothetical protein HYH03_005249 [Edaphochlamys debaryana]